MSVDIMQIQPQLTKHFAQLIENNSLAHAYLLHGDDGTGKLELAIWVAQSIFCLQKQKGFPCGQCSECIRIKDNNHPDVVLVAPDGQSIKVEQVRYLKSEFSKSGVESRKKVFIIQDADKMTTGAANSLLKFIEEPSGEVTAFLLTKQVNKILPTIVSRCQMIELSRLDYPVIVSQLEELGLSVNDSHILARLTNSPENAKVISENEEYSKRVEYLWNWFNFIMKHDLRSFTYVSSKLMTVCTRREDYNMTLQIVMFMLRDLMMKHFGQDNQITFAVYQRELQEYTQRYTVDQLLQGIDLVLKAQKRIEENLSFQNVFESLTIELLRCYH